MARHFLSARELGPAIHGARRQAQGAWPGRMRNEISSSLLRGSDFIDLIAELFL